MRKRQAILEAKNITKAFYHPTQVEVLKDVNLSIQRGDSLAIMGTSGEGKSTLLHILGSLENPCSGSVHIAGKELPQKNNSLAAKIRNQHLGFIFQTFNLLDDYSVIENVMMPARIGRKNVTKGTETYERSHALLEMVNLSHRMHFPAKLLSGGERQRVAIARALCNDPEIILADEPSGNLDHQNSEIIHNLLLNTTCSQGKALIVVTHNKELAKLCANTSILNDHQLQLLTNH